MSLKDGWAVECLSFLSQQVKCRGSREQSGTPVSITDARPDHPAQAGHVRPSCWVEVGGKKKKAKTEQREAGVKATGRKERGLIWRQVDTGGPQARPPSEPQTVDQRQAHVLPFPEEARARAVCNDCLLFLNGLHFNQWASSPKNILYPGKIKCTPAEYQVKPCNLETM